MKNLVLPFALTSLLLRADHGNYRISVKIDAPHWELAGLPFNLSDYYGSHGKFSLNLLHFCRYEQDGHQLL